jgi:predicted esterase YcpF (UPF0227 family)
LLENFLICKGADIALTHILPMTTYLYLHGFASSPNSAKAHYLRDRFFEQGIPLHCPDLNQDDFSHLTLTRQIHQVETLMPPTKPTILIGSSLGGLTAAWVGDRQPQVQQIILLAPAFDFLDYWLPRLGDSQVQQWRDQNALSVYHHATQQMETIHYSLVTDMENYPTAKLQRPVPTLIVHGRSDEVIPLQASQAYAAPRPWVTLIEVDSDHALTDVRSLLWEIIRQHLSIEPTNLHP